MASIQRLKSGSWRAQVRRKGLESLSRTFKLQGDARRWATEAAHRIDQGLTIDSTVALGNDPDTGTVNRSSHRRYVWRR